MRTGFRRLAWWRWVLAVLCAGFVGLWVVREFRPLVAEKWTRQGLSITVNRLIIAGGGVAIGRDRHSLIVSAPFEWQEEPFYSRGRWWFRWLDRQNRWSGQVFAWGVRIPLWLPGALLAALTALGWRQALRERGRSAMTHCAKCGYDRHGLPDTTVCPECGAEKTSRRGAEARGDGGGR